MNLQFANLNYGSTGVKVKPSEITPLPLVFDFDNAEACARQIFAIMSNASGGFQLNNCTLRLHRGRKSANLTCNGTHIYYADESQPKLGVEDLIQMTQEVETFKLGSVVTDQYGEGWKRAKWVEEQAA